MAAIVAEGMRAGALGFSTSRTLAHRTPDGKPTPTLDAAEDELAAIADALGAAGQGWLQVISDFVDVDSEFAMLRRLAARARRPLTLSLLQRDTRPEQWQTILERIAAANRGRHENDRPGDGPADRRHAGLRDFAEPVHGPSQLSPDRKTAVPRKAGRAAPAGDARQAARRNHRGSGAAPSGQ